MLKRIPFVDKRTDIALVRANHSGAGGGVQIQGATSGDVPIVIPANGTPTDVAALTLVTTKGHISLEGSAFVVNSDTTPVNNPVTAILQIDELGVLIEGVFDIAPSAHDSVSIAFTTGVVAAGTYHCRLQLSCTPVGTVTVPGAPGPASAALSVIAG
jgi:hypothetical protein